MTYICGVLLAFMLFVMMMPEAFGRMFGSSAIDVGSQLNTALCVFSVMLIPYALVANLRVLYQIIGYRIMSVVLSIAQLVVMVLFVWIFSLISPENLWWGFPASAIVLLVIVLLVAWYKRRQRPEAAPVTLIPSTTEGKVLNFSVRLTREDVAEALNDISAFLSECQLTKSADYSVRLCCEELLYNIVNYAIRKSPEKHFADVHIRYLGSQVTVLLKDDGRPFNPVITELPESTDHLGLRLVKGSTQINYKYMYDQNMVFFTIKN